MADKKISQLTSASTPLTGTEVLPLVQSGTTLKATAENIFTTIQPSGNANGIVYLNGSKQATTSASFFYNGSNLGVNTSSVTAIFGKTVQLGDGTTNNTIYMVGAGGGSGFLANVGTVFSLTGRGSTTLAFGTNDADRVTIDLSGNTTLLMGNLVMGTAGKGIDFSANTHAPGMTSELLNDYEEGTWTPTATTSGTAPTVDQYLERIGSYTKIGNTVFVRCYLRLDISNAGTGDVRITGLPYNAQELEAISPGLRTALSGGVPATANPYINGANAEFGGCSWAVQAGGYLCFTAMYKAA